MASSSASPGRPCRCRRTSATLTARGRLLIQSGHRRAVIRTLHITDAGAWPSRAFADPFVVCHGRDGPIDSIGWAVPAESRQDDALLQTQQITPTERLLC